MKLKKIAVLSLLSFMTLVSCGRTSSQPTTAPTAPVTSAVATSGNTTSNSGVTYVTRAKLKVNYKGLDFKTMGAQEVTTNFTHIDGDTTHFNGLAIRYWGIDTPESTLEIEPWGKSASANTKRILSSAKHIVVTRPDMALKKPDLDSYGSRYLGLVWYATVDNPTLDDFKLVNLEVIQDGYSDSTAVATNPLYKLFEDASNKAKEEKLNIWSGDDPNFDYKNGEEVTLKDLNANIASYVGKKVHFNGIVAIKDGHGNAWVEQAEEDGTTYGLFLNSEGQTIRPIQDITTTSGQELSPVGNQIYVTGTIQQSSDYGYQITGLKTLSTGETAPDYDRQYTKVIKRDQPVVVQETTLEKLPSISLGAPISIQEELTVESVQDKTVVFAQGQTKLSVTFFEAPAFKAGEKVSIKKAINLKDNKLFVYGQEDYEKIA